MSTYLAPFIVLAVAPVAVMLAVAFYRRHWLAALLTVTALLTASYLFAVPEYMGEGRELTPLFMADSFASYYAQLILFAALGVTVLAFAYFHRAVRQPEEFYVLLLTGTFGAATLAEANHFASFFLGLETLSVSLYAMIAYTPDRKTATEAAVKYLVLAAAASAFLVFGMALVYAQTGTMNFAQIAEQMPLVKTPLFYGGLALMLVGIGFKLAVAPFHLWTPDVYEGAPAPVTAFIATVSKGAVFAVSLRLFSVVDVDVMRPVWIAFAVIAMASMIVGNLLALMQTNVKRLLAYSSIAHLGYLLVAFLSFGPTGMAAAAFYLAAYFVTILGAFGVVTVHSPYNRDADRIEDYAGLLWRRPWLASIFALMLLSLAGIPLTAGFIGKIYVVTAGEHAAGWVLVFTLAITSAVSIFYYLRVIVAMIRPLPAKLEPIRALSWTGMAALFALTVLLVIMGVYPAPFFDAVLTMATLPWKP